MKLFSYKCRWEVYLSETSSENNILQLQNIEKFFFHYEADNPFLIDKFKSHVILILSIWSHVWQITKKNVVFLENIV